jgi:lipoyl(octanoyl) transferase
VDIRPLGRVDFAESWALQMQLLTQRIRDEIDDTLLILEHFDVISLGRKFPGLEDLITSGVKEWKGLTLFFVERGGEATYHGPGQLVMYPIFRLPERLGPKAFLRFLEVEIIKLLADFNPEAFSIEGSTGVWVKDQRGRDRKIASLGIAARSMVTYHGLALNISTDLKQFEKISPCGFTPETMTSMEDILQDSSLSFGTISEALAKRIQESFPIWKERL